MITPDASLASISLKTYQDYATKFMDFGVINTRSALQFAQDVWTARSPSDISDAMVDYGRRQFECWSEELEELSVAAGGATSKDEEIVGLGD